MTALSQCNVLFVDDEAEILKALRRSLHNEPYQCLFADSGKAAIPILEKKTVHVMVSDMCMPQMTGLELLAHAQKHHPNTIRLVLSGWSDSKSIIEAVNTGYIYRYIIKPWDNRELKIVIRQALEIYLLQEEKLQLLQQLEDQNRKLESLVEQRTQQLLKLSSQAEVGKYASQIVHNLNNPLHALGGALDIANLLLNQDNGCDAAKLKKAVEMARLSTSKLQGIVSGILHHVRDERTFHIAAVNINKVIEQELTFFDLDPIFKKSIVKEVDLSDQLPSLMGSAVQIKQIINNLVGNAVDAMEFTAIKRLSVKTAAVDGSILIQIADTGTGIDEKDLPHIFSPDFTTKPAGKGTGLGLASVQTMVAAYAGDIQVYSEKGRGTTFIVRLPVKDPAARSFQA